jgi:membrane fusion protein (multidrug efflux system)
MYRNNHNYFHTIMPQLNFIVCVLAIVTLLLSGCGQPKPEDANVDKRVYEKQENNVEVMVLNKTTFHKEIISNGKLKALTKSELKFKVSGELRQLNFQNGNAIKEGQIIAILDQFEYHQKLEQAQTTLKMASINLQDELLSYGGAKMNRDSIPRSIYESATIRSGYISATRDLKSAEFNLEGTVLKAPFGGKVANVKKNVHELVSSGEAFCAIIDDKEFEVEFHLIESEIAEVAINNNVKIMPFAVNATYSGTISEINPLVEESGLVLVKASVKNNGLLWEGMNVKVLIEKKVHDKLVVPKAAVVLRQNQEVLFKYVKGRASWIYIQTEQENSTSYSVIAHPDKGGELHPGDTIIVSDNLNLAHESNVVIKKVVK